jgi:hypothetical protein
MNISYFAFFAMASALAVLRLALWFSSFRFRLRRSSRSRSRTMWLSFPDSDGDDFLDPHTITETGGFVNTGQGAGRQETEAGRK